MTNKTLDDVIVNVKEWKAMQEMTGCSEKIYLYNTKEDRSSHIMYESEFKQYKLTQEKHEGTDVYVRR